MRLERERAAEERRISAEFARFCRSGDSLDLYLESFSRLDLESFARLDLESFSRLERDFYRRAGTPLLQFGYDAFSVVTGGEVLSTGAISPGYVLGIGDEFIVTFHGQTSGTHTIFVDREGRLIVPDMPPLAAAGRSFGDVRDELRARTKATFLGTEVFVSLGSVRQIAVQVVGSVGAPGLHRLTSLSTVTDALAMAGGVDKTGSLRRIRVRRGDSVFTVDLYDLLTGEALGDRLSVVDGDRIFVPPIGATVAITGEVKRAGIFELADGESRADIETLLRFGAGTLRPRGHVFNRIAFTSDGRERVSQVNRGFDRVADGDIVIVMARGNIQRGSVELLGHVRVPGRRSLGSAPTLRALVGDVSLFQTDPYLLFAVLITTDPKNRNRRLFPVNLVKILAGEQDYSLRDNDILVVFSNDDIRYLNSTEVRNVLLERPVPGLSLVEESIAEVIRRASEDEDQDQDADEDEDDGAASIGAPRRADDLDICPGLKALAAVVSASGNRRFDTATQSGISDNKLE